MLYTIHDKLGRTRHGTAYWAESPLQAKDAYARSEGFETYEDFCEENDIVDPSYKGGFYKGAAKDAISVWDLFSVDSFVATVDGDKTLRIAAHIGDFCGSAWVGLLESDPDILFDVFVPISYRGQGIGTALILEAMYWAKGEGRSLQLHVGEDNVAAQRLYRRLDWIEVGVKDKDVWFASPDTPPLPDEAAPKAVKPMIYRATRPA